MWALCRSDHGLSWPEFMDLTFPQFEALEERRTIRIRHERFNAALIASGLYNVNRHGDAEPLSPFDFLPGYEADEQVKEAERERKAIIRGIRQTLGRLPKGENTPERVAELVVKMKERLRANGHDDADAIMTEAFPNL